MTTPERVSRETAQAAIDGQAVARILREAQTNFLNVYPPDVLSLGVGPMQSIIGLAILNGHLALPRAPLSPAVLAELPEVRALIRAETERCAGIAMDRWAAHRESADRTFELDHEGALEGALLSDTKAAEAQAIAAAIREGRNG